MIATFTGNIQIQIRSSRTARASSSSLGTSSARSRVGSSHLFRIPHAVLLPFLHLARTRIKREAIRCTSHTSVLFTQTFSVRLNCHKLRHLTRDHLTRDTCGQGRKVSSPVQVTFVPVQPLGVGRRGAAAPSATPTLTTATALLRGAVLLERELFPPESRTESAALIAAPRGQPAPRSCDARRTELAHCDVRRAERHAPGGAHGLRNEQRGARGLRHAQRTARGLRHAQRRAHGLRRSQRSAYVRGHRAQRRSTVLPYCLFFVPAFACSTLWSHIRTKRSSARLKCCVVFLLERR